MLQIFGAGKEKKKERKDLPDYDRNQPHKAVLKKKKKKNKVHLHDLAVRVQAVHLWQWKYACTQHLQPIFFHISVLFLLLRSLLLFPLEVVWESWPPTLRKYHNLLLLIAAPHRSTQWRCKVVARFFRGALCWCCVSGLVLLWVPAASPVRHVTSKQRPCCASSSLEHLKEPVLSIPNLPAKHSLFILPHQKFHERTFSGNGF